MVGSVNVDRVMRVPALPAAGETVVGAEVSLWPGGKGGNAAAAAAWLGAATVLVAAVGDDTEAEGARAALDVAGVDVGAIVTRPGPTGVAHITVDDAGENTIVVASGANALLDGHAVSAAVADRGGEGTVVLVDLEVPDAAVAAAAEAARDVGARVVLDPAPARRLQRDVLAGLDALTPNAGELRGLGIASVEELLGLGAGAVVVTRGGDGADLHVPNHPPRHQPAFAIDVRDTTGAGDAFAAGYAVARAGGADRAEAVRWAAAAGALATRAVGARASLGTRDEVQRMLAGD